MSCAAFPPLAPFSLCRTTEPDLLLEIPPQPPRPSKVSRNLRSISPFRFEAGFSLRDAQCGLWIMTIETSMRRAPALMWTAIVMALFGLALAAGGVWLAALGGSLYYLIA